MMLAAFGGALGAAVVGAIAFAALSGGGDDNADAASGSSEPCHIAGARHVGAVAHGGASDRCTQRYERRHAHPNRHGHGNAAVHSQLRQRQASR